MVRGAEQDHVPILTLARASKQNVEGAIGAGDGAESTASAGAEACRADAPRRRKRVARVCGLHHEHSPELFAIGHGVAGGMPEGIDVSVGVGRDGATPVEMSGGGIQGALLAELRWIGLGICVQKWAAVC